MIYIEPKIFYSQADGSKGTQVNGVITNYKPPTPAINNKGNKVLLGYTHFQKAIKADTLIKFSLVFDIQSAQDITSFKEFRTRYNEYFYFEDELGTLYKGKLVNSYDIDMPIEGEIYYIALELLCGHDISGYV